MSDTHFVLDANQQKCCNIKKRQWRISALRAKMGLKMLIFTAKVTFFKLNTLIALPQL